SWRTKCSAQLLQWKVTDSVVYADALNDAYKRLADPVSHRRRVAFIDARFWLIIDDLCGSATHRVDLRFQFAPLIVHSGENEWASATRDGVRGLLLRAFTSVPITASVRQGWREPLEGWVSTDYGCMEPAPALVYSTEACLPIRLMTLLWPTED